MHESAEREEDMRRAGALAYLTKDRPSEERIAAIRAVEAGASYSV